MRKYFLYGVVLVLTACGSNEQKAKEPVQPQGPLAKSANSDAFNLSFGKLLADYYSLKDNFIDEKDSGIAQSARSLMVSVDSLQLDELKADSNLVVTARTYALGISSELKGLLGETKLEEKRKSFQMVGDQLYDLIRTVQYDRAVVYHDYCPMAFNDQGANWLSNTPEIRNPYIPKKMISCGEVKDSIDFRRKQ
ncbi:MAG: DUF3347 domain-containing protein [Bacteroidota bacterium]